MKTITVSMKDVMVKALAKSELSDANIDAHNRVRVHGKFVPKSIADKARGPIMLRQHMAKISEREASIQARRLEINGELSVQYARRANLIKDVGDINAKMRPVKNDLKAVETGGLMTNANLALKLMGFDNPIQTLKDSIRNFWREKSILDYQLRQVEEDITVLKAERATLNVLR